MRNPYLRDFRDQMRQRFAEDSDSMSMSEWIMKNTTLRKKPFSFKGYEFQQQIVDDMHPDMYVIKVSQIGLSEVQLRKFGAFLTRNVGVKAIFTLPDDTMFERISKTRFKPIIETDKVFNLSTGTGIKPIRSIPLYQIGQSFGFFTGQKASDATSIDADAIFNDEVDLSDPEILALFQSRLQNSQHRITQRFSTPTLQGYGIDAGFQISDQHEYMTKCPHCNHYNIPEFTPQFINLPGLSSDINDLLDLDQAAVDKLDVDGSYVMCEQCHEPLDMHDPMYRSWVARFPGRRVRGYRVSPFATPRLTPAYIIDQLMKYKRTDAIRHFHNTVLGKPYNDSNARLSELDIRAVMSSPALPLVHSTTPVVIGIDVGLTCHLVLYHLETLQPIAFSWTQVPSSNLLHEIQRLLDLYNIVGGLIDRHPYTPLANDVRDLSGGRILPCEYGLPSASEVTIVKDPLGETDHVRINRTTALDAFVGMVRKRKTSIQGYGNHEPLVVNHLQNMVRIEKADEPAVWKKVNEDDHFFHAGSYGNFAIRVHDAIRYRMDMDMREMVSAHVLTISMQGENDLGMRDRRRTSMSIGAMN